jgi:hypothetical protein
MAGDTERKPGIGVTLSGGCIIDTYPELHLKTLSYGSDAITENFTQETAIHLREIRTFFSSMRMNNQ